MNSSKLVHGDSKQELEEWVLKRQFTMLCEAAYFRGEADLPAGMAIPPDWVRVIAAKLETSIVSQQQQALEKIKANPKDFYSWGIFMGGSHAASDQIDPVFEKAAKDMENTFDMTEEQIEKTIASLNIPITDEVPDTAGEIKSYVQGSMASVAKLPTEDAQELLKGYAKGLKFKIRYDADSDYFDRDGILGILWIIWPKVEGCKSVAELNRELNLVTKHQADPDAPPKRLEAICREIGLTLGPRGRPKNPKSTDSDV